MVKIFGSIVSMVIQTLFVQFSPELQPLHFIDPGHAFYLSVIEVAYPVEDGKTALRIKVFTDDLQNAVSEFQQTKELVSQEQLCGTSLDHVNGYLKQHVQISLDAVPVKFQLRDCRVEGDSHWLTFEISAKPWTKIELTADFFMELFPTQTHVVSILSGDKKQFARLTKNRPTCLFEF